MKSFGDEAIGMISRSNYTSDLDSPSNKQFVAGMVQRYRRRSRASTPPACISTAMVAEAALKALGGKSDDKEALIKAMRAVSLHGFAARPVPLRSFRQRRSATSSSAGW